MGSEVDGRGRGAFGLMNYTYSQTEQHSAEQQGLWKKIILTESKALE